MMGYKEEIRRLEDVPDHNGLQVLSRLTSHPGICGSNEKSGISSTCNNNPNQQRRSSEHLNQSSRRNPALHLSKYASCGDGCTPAVIAPALKPTARSDGGEYEDRTARGGRES